jgi:hypothetical protein
MALVYSHQKQKIVFNKAIVPGRIKLIYQKMENNEE